MFVSNQLANVCTVCYVTHHQVVFACKAEQEHQAAIKGKSVSVTSFTLNASLTGASLLA